MVSQILGYSMNFKINIFETHIPQRFLKQGKLVFECKFNDSREKHAQRGMKINKITKNHVTFSDICWSEAALLEANM